MFSSTIYELSKSEQKWLFRRVRRTGKGHVFVYLNTIEDGIALVDDRGSTGLRRVECDLSTQRRIYASGVK